MKKVRLRWFAVATALALVVGACGGGEDVADDNPDTSTPNTAANVDCESETPEATEIGVTADEITITVIADTGSPIRPGLFKGSVESIQKWAEYMNREKGGLACRKIVVKTADSKLAPDESKNALVEACSSSLATVGTTALFLNDMSPSENCKDKAGKVTGLPDLAVLQTEANQQCSEVSYAVLGTSSECPYSGEGERTFRVSSTPADYFTSLYPDEKLHGIFVIPSDLPSTIASTMPLVRSLPEFGIEIDDEFGASGFSTQPDYTPFAQAIKQHNSTFAQVGLDYKGTVFMRKEAQAQGVDTVKVWACSTQCYDPKFLSEGGAAVEDEYVYINLLPFEDKGSNDTLDALLENYPETDGFGAQAWIAGEAFAAVINKIVEEDGVNGITRASVLEGIKNTHEFDAGGLIPTIDLGGKRGSNCVVMMQVQDNKFVRVAPEEEGEFLCDGEVTEITLDPQKEFKG
jgi:hypothetical protein